MAEQQEGRWVILDNGVHLFIKKGQTLDDAIEQNISKDKQEEQKDYDNLPAREYGQKYAKTETKSVKGAPEPTEEMYDFIREHPDAKEAVNKMLNEGIDWNTAVNYGYSDYKKKYAENKEVEQPKKDPKRYDPEEYSQLEMYDHVEEDLGLDWHDVKQTYFLENTFEESPKNAVVELKNGNYIEYNIETGERKDVKGEDWIDPWNRKTGLFKSERQRKEEKNREIDGPSKVSSNDFGTATMFGPKSKEDLEKLARAKEKVYLEYEVNGRKRGFWKAASSLLRQINSGTMRIYDDEKQPKKDPK